MVDFAFYASCTELCPRRQPCFRAYFKSPGQPGLVCALGTINRQSDSTSNLKRYLGPSVLHIVSHIYVHTSSYLDLDSHSNRTHYHIDDIDAFDIANYVNFVNCFYVLVDNVYNIAYNVNVHVNFNFNDIDYINFHVYHNFSDIYYINYYVTNYNLDVNFHLNHNFNYVDDDAHDNINNNKHNNNYDYNHINNHNHVAYNHHHHHHHHHNHHVPTSSDVDILQCRAIHSLS
ncbi:hypothetical protein AYL99_06384 [Fonsecaea erecta]|uniref:Uncharacterized protein n=1 Tax=Fonsecaea erecta TaxID=1367422 RepID=A0A178ZI12_9EURO|nr:hypothetical protein AYL99_06384 [Fonsecaea erecta]OAP59086.1 hypothetical protein AYL99_06384 [Fonsecaea erecta]